jgi:hypothetical protein
MKNKNGIIIPLAWPDALVASNLLKYDEMMSWFNLCRNGFYKVGHAAMLLIHTETGEVHYYDFGRYIAEPRRYGRIRSVKTDAELEFNVKADISNNDITNLGEVLKYTAAHPHTHGEGTLYAGICPGYNFEEVYAHIERRQAKGLIKYGAFTLGGTNCSRFVAQTMAAFSTWINKVKYLIPWYGTPSPLGNVFKSYNQIMYIVADGKLDYKDVSEFSTQFNTLKRKVLFGYDDPEIPHIKESRKGCLYPERRPDFVSSQAQWIGGIGAGAWHELLDIQAGTVCFRRTQESGHIDIEEYFHLRDNGKGVDPNKNYKFLPGTSCAQLLIQQDKQKWVYLPPKERQLSYLPEYQLAETGS